MPAAIEGILLGNKLMNTSITSEALNIRDTDVGNISAIWSGTDSISATIDIQVSSSSAGPWLTLPHLRLVLDAASGYRQSLIGEVLTPWLRVVYTKDINTTGTFTCRYFLKSLK